MKKNLPRLKAASPIYSIKLPNYSQAIQIFSKGIGLHQRGQLAQAKTAYEQVLKIQPKHFDALHMLGVIAAQSKSPTLAVDFFGKALEITSNHPEANFNCGNAFREVHKMEEAIICYERAIKVNPKFAEAYLNRGLSLEELMRLDEAVESYNVAIEINPRYAQAYFNRGNALQKLKRLEDALANYERSIEINPEFAEAYCRRAHVQHDLQKMDAAVTSYELAITIYPDFYEAHFNKGLVLLDLLRFEDAAVSFQLAIKFKPKYSEAYVNCGNALKQLNRFEDALDCYNKAIEINPQLAEAYSNRGEVLRKLNKMDAALSDFSKALQINPFYADAYNNRANLLKDLKQFEEALKDYDRAIAFKPEYAEAHFNKSLIYLTKMEFIQGWLLYEWRWIQDQIKFERFKKDFKNSVWRGEENLKNQTILIYAEQGVGDQILHSSMLRDISSIFKNIKVLIDDRLISLFKRSFPQIEFLSLDTNIKNIKFDLYVSMGDLGKYFRKSVSDFDELNKNYLLADKIYSNEIKKSLLNNKKLLCGIAWNSKNEKIGTSKSIQLNELLPILRINDCAFVSLQYGVPDQDLYEFNQKEHVNIQSYDSIDNFNNLDGHSALIEACDFVVSVSNTTAHMAGALGKETFLLYPLGEGAIWYWSNLLNNKNLWYPSVKINEQIKIGSWVEPVEEVKAEILEKLNASK